MKNLLTIIGLIALTACQPPQTTKSAPLENNATQNNILALDWGVASTLTAIGVPVLATGDLHSYPKWVMTPALPASTLDMGSRFSPNPELLAQMPIDTIIDTDFYQHLRSMYGDAHHISFVVEGVKHGSDGTPKTIANWEEYAGAVASLGQQLGHHDGALAYLEAAKAQMIRHGQTFKTATPHIKKLAIAQFSDSKNLRLYANNSLFKPATELMGVELATLGVGNAWGYADLTLGELSELDDETCLIVIEPFSPMLQAELSDTALWQRLGFGKERCFAILPPVWTFGGVPSMVGFAESLAGATFSHAQGGK